ncbi:MAG TPA: glycosyltransferase [Longimicrobiales bacterium]|nr:glycosyltransferase [Longimicrobiales bacterium]
MRRSCHVWLPELYATRGGIQTYSAFLIQALGEVWPGTRCEVFLKNDDPSGAAARDVRLHASGGVPGWLRTPGYAARIGSRALLDRPELVIAGHLNFAVVSDWLSRIAGIPYWIVTYGIEAWNVERPALKRALSRAACVVSISRYTARRLIEEQGLDPDLVTVLPCTFDAARFRPRERSAQLLERLGIDVDQPVVLTVARLAGKDRHKGYDVVLEALPEIRREVPGLHYLIVGEGDDRRRIEGRVRALGLERSVTLAGLVPDEELPEYYGLANLFAMPSKREGFGIVYLEAMACGIPAIGGDRDGARDALVDGELGVLVDPDDVPAFARASVEVLTGRHPNRVLYDPAELRRRVVERFGPESFRRRLGEILADHGLVEEPWKAR